MVCEFGLARIQRNFCRVLSRLAADWLAIAGRGSRSGKAFFAKDDAPGDPLAG